LPGRWCKLACVAAWLVAAPAADCLVAEVVVEAVIEARQYSWTVKNLGSEPISSIEIPVYHASSFVVPPGWTSKGSSPDKFLHARATEPDADIRDGQEQIFRCAILYQSSWQGKGTVRIGFRDGGVVELADVRVPVREPRSSVWTTPVILLVLVGLAVLVGRRRAAKAAEQQDQP